MKAVSHTKESYISKYISSIFLVYILFISCGDASSRISLEECEKVRTGVFHPIGDRSYMVERKGTEQIEKNLKTGDSFFFDVIWLNACNYTLELVHTEVNDSAPLVKGDKMQVEILSVTDSSYTYRLVYDKKFLEAELIKIN